jgi:UDP-N-acetylmuramate dehydrogenase
MQFATGKLLKDFSTFGIGGPAKALAEAKTIEQMQELLAYCKMHAMPYLVIGKGSNALFDDRGFDGLVIVNKIAFCSFEGNRVCAGAGYSFALLGVQTARRGLAGLEFASGIPGTVGGAVYMNAGASGGQTADVIDEVTYITDAGEKQVFAAKHLSFSYRTSPFQGRRGAIVAATFALTSSCDARTKQLELVEYRTRTQPYGEMSCGCVFRNPEGHSAGRLIEQAGLKDLQEGGAKVSPLHANFIVNAGGATAADVLRLAEKVKRCVMEKTGIPLEMELCVLPATFSC